MMSMLNLLWIVPVVAAVAWGFGYKANPERVKAFVKAHIVDEDPYQDEGHSATRYAPEPGESPIAREARKAAEVGAARPEEIEGARLILKYGTCSGHMDIRCGGDDNNCPGPNSRCDGWHCHRQAESAHRWLLNHGINPDEAKA